MDAKKLFLACLDQASAVVAKVSADQFSNPTPDTEWDVRTLAGHVLYELAWVSDVVEGKTVQEVGDKYDGDLIGNDLAASWEKYLELAKKSVETADLNATVHLSYGDVTLADYLQEAAADQLIHSWDLAVATGQEIRYDPEVAQIIYEYSKPKMRGLAATGLFAPPVQINSNAGIQQKLLALYGRNPDWPR